MTRFRHALLAIALGAATFGPAGAATQFREGKVRVTGTVQFSANVPVGATVVGSAGVGFSDYPKTGTGGGQGVGVYSEVTRAGAAATFTLDVPYLISANAGRFDKVGLDVSFSVRGPTTSAAITQTIEVPADGATTPVSFSLSL